MIKISRCWDFEPKKLVSFVDKYVDHFWDDMANVYEMKKFCEKIRELVRIYI